MTIQLSASSLQELNDQTCHFIDLKGRKFEIRTNSIIWFRNYIPDVNPNSRKEDLEFDQFYWLTTRKRIYEVHTPELTFMVDKETSERLETLVKMLEEQKTILSNAKV